MKQTHALKFISALLVLLSGSACTERPAIDRQVMDGLAEQLKQTGSFGYPLEDYFPEIPFTSEPPPKGERYHAAEDSFAPAGTPVHAIGDGVIRYSGTAKGYGWLMIIDHPDMNVYSLYGHLSKSRWRKPSGPVSKGELIAYLGEAAETDTMVPHLHFGLRMGQKADYPRWGDWRWMAGYTNRAPDLVGWFRPSEIIGETPAMREWRQSIKKRESIGIGRTLSPDDFKITAGKYNEKEDLYRVIQTEFGDDYRMADWNDILPFRATIENWADRIGLPVGEENALFISNDGYRIWLGRQYYISRFSHGKPGQFLAHDEIDDEFVCLGSWYDLARRVLCVKR